MSIETITGQARSAADRNIGGGSRCRKCGYCNGKDGEGGRGELHYVDMWMWGVAVVSGIEDVVRTAFGLITCSGGDVRWGICIEGNTSALIV